MSAADPQPPILRRRRSGCYSVVDRPTWRLLGSVMRQPTGWWIAVDRDGNRIGPPGSTEPALYGTRRGAVADLLTALELSDG